MIKFEKWPFGVYRFELKLPFVWFQIGITTMGSIFELRNWPYCFKFWQWRTSAYVAKPYVSIRKVW